MTGLLILTWNEVDDLEHVDTCQRKMTLTMSASGTGGMFGCR